MFLVCNVYAVYTLYRHETFIILVYCNIQNYLLGPSNLDYWISFCYNTDILKISYVLNCYGMMN